MIHITYIATSSAPELTVKARNGKAALRKIAEGERDPQLYGRRKVLTYRGVEIEISADGQIFEI